MNETERSSFDILMFVFVAVGFLTFVASIITTSIPAGVVAWILMLLGFGYFAIAGD